MNVLKKVLKVIGKLLVFVVITLFIVSSTAALGLVYTQYTTGKPVNNIIDNLINTQEEEKNSINVLIIGVNQHLADFIVVARYNPKTGQASLLSIPRDTKYTGIDGPNTAYSKINAIYQGQYIDKMIAKVEDILDIEINNYIIFEKDALWQVVDAVGGVAVDVGNKPLKYEDPEQDLYINLPAGVQTLNGKQAEQYVRYRKGYRDGDLGRIKAQQNFMMEFIKQCLKANNITKIPSVAKIAFDNVKTDISLDVILYYLEDIVTFKVENVRMETLPGSPKTIKEVSFFIMDEGKIKTLVDEMFRDTAIEQERGE